MWSVKINTRGPKDQNRKYIEHKVYRADAKSYPDRNEYHFIREKSIEFAVSERSALEEEKEEKEDEEKKAPTYLCSITLSLLQEI